MQPNDFEEIRVLGRGSFGKVVQVRKRDSGEIFAMKILKKEMVIAEGMAECIWSEKEILTRADNPFIVTLYDAFQTPEKLYLLLQYLPGGELFFHLKEGVRFSLDQARFYAAELVLALSHLHSHTIIYNDLKPENCVLDAEGHVVLVDFDLSRAKFTPPIPASDFCGSPEYLSPEMLQGQGGTFTVDWWGLGLLLYEFLTGLPPFYSENISEMYELILQKPLTFPDGMPEDAKSLMRGLLERNPSLRLGTHGVEEIMSHPFFASAINWDDLSHRRIAPPFVPVPGVSYFEPEFTSEPLKQSFSPRVSEADNEKYFSKFDFHRDRKWGSTTEEEEDELERFAFLLRFSFGFLRIRLLLGGGVSLRVFGTFFNIH